MILKKRSEPLRTLDEIFKMNGIHTDGIPETEGKDMNTWDTANKLIQRIEESGIFPCRADMTVIEQALKLYACFEDILNASLFGQSHHNWELKFPETIIGDDD